MPDASESGTVVIGGGVIGVCIAYELARRGQAVTLLERAEIGAGSSSGNAGIIAIGHPPLPRPGLVAQVLRWTLNRSSPLYVPLRFDRDLIAWMWRFRRSCTQAHFEYCMDMLSRLGRLSNACFDRMLAEESLACEFHRKGWYELFCTQRGFDAGKHEAEVLTDAGFEVEVVDGNELRRREPAVIRDLAGAIRYTESATTEPMAFLIAVADAARGHGADIRTNTPVQRIDVENGRVTAVRTAHGERFEAPTVVMAGGIWSTDLVRPLGLSIPMQAGKGYHRDIERPDPCLSTSCVISESHTALTPMGNWLRLAGTVEFSGLNHTLEQRRLDMMTEATAPWVAGVDGAKILDEWCGLRPCTADGLPLVGWADRPGGLFIATGHARMGLTLAPGTAQVAAECILDGKPSIDIAPMRVNRFE